VGIILSPYLKAASKLEKWLSPLPKLTKQAFGKNFVWGAACAAYQVEGAWNADGKGPSIWDEFTHHKHKIERGETGDVATDFYHRYKEDIGLLKQMNFEAFRFSLSWSRIFPKGIGKVNPAGVKFYHNVIDFCLTNNITPWITIYHWDLPQALEEKGGWKSREIVNWFSQYTDFVTKEYGSKVKNWMVLNEPLSFTALGYMTGEMAPGHHGFRNFFPAVHHAVLCQAEGGRIIRRNVPDANIGTTFALSWVNPENGKSKSRGAARRYDALMNRIFVEPAMGLGYPIDRLPGLKKIKKYMLPGDEEKMKFNFDFLGVQNYHPVTVKKNWFPLIHAKEIPASKLGVKTNCMGGEINGKDFYNILKQFGKYKTPLVVTENGVCFNDKLESGHVHDEKRIAFFKEYLQNLLKAKQNGVDIRGYFVWSLTDNFEWDKGYRPRFGLIYIDYKNNLKRVMKDSGYWFMHFLK
jgi:beta-glucosidase